MMRDESRDESGMMRDESRDESGMMRDGSGMMREDKSAATRGIKYSSENAVMQVQQQKSSNREWR